MLRLRVAGGTVHSRWVPLRFDRGRRQLHAIVENADWEGRLEMGTAVIVDIAQLTDEERGWLRDALEIPAAGQ